MAVCKREEFIREKALSPWMEKPEETMFYTSEKELKLLGTAASDFAGKLLLQEEETPGIYPRETLEYHKGKEGFLAFSDAHKMVHMPEHFHGALHKAFELGFFLLNLPEEMDGMGRKISPLCIVLHHLAKKDASFGAMVFTHLAAQELLVLTNAQSLLPDMDNIRDCLLSYPVYQDFEKNLPDITWKKENGKYILDGELSGLVLAGFARKALIPAISPEEKGFSHFLVDLTQAGVLISPPVATLGTRGCPMADIRFTGASASLAGKEGEGVKDFNRLACRMGVCAAALSGGIMLSGFREAKNYAQKRFQGGRKIINWSQVEKLLSQMACSLRIAEMLITRAAQAADEEEKEWESASLAAKHWVTGTASRFMGDAIQVMGGYGYMEDYGQEKRFRDARQLNALFGAPAPGWRAGIHVSA